jgi:hypothetical protein
MVKLRVWEITIGYVRGVQSKETPAIFPELSEIDGSMAKIQVLPVNGKPDIPRVCDPKAGYASSDPVWKIKHQGLIFIIA